MYLWFIPFNPTQITHKILKIMSGKTCLNENRCDGSDDGPSAAITVDASQGSVHSILYDASPMTP